MPKKTLPISFMILVTIVALSCGNSDLKVKPDKTSSPPTTTPQLEEDIQSFLRTPAAMEIDNESTANINHVYVLELTCGHYLVSYGSMPDTLNDLLDGFTFLWPESIYTGKPMKILDSMPDTNNPNDIGGVYYERINNYSGKLYWLDKTPSNSESTGYEWTMSSHPIKPTVSKSTMDDTYEEAPFLTEMTPAEREWFGFERNLQMTLPFLIYDGIDRRSYVEDNILDILNASQYYISKSGYDKLKSGLNEGVLKFDIGSRVDMEHFYFLYYNTEDPYLPVCFEMQVDGTRSNLKVNCPEFDSKNANSFFNSDDFDSYTFPDEVFITKYDIL